MLEYLTPSLCSMFCALCILHVLCTVHYEHCMYCVLLCSQSQPIHTAYSALDMGLSYSIIISVIMNIETVMFVVLALSVSNQVPTKC